MWEGARAASVQWTGSFQTCAGHTQGPRVCSVTQPCFPEGHLPTLYDFHFDSKRNHWIPWSELVPEYIHDHHRKFIDILGEQEEVRVFPGLAGTCPP